MDNPPFFTASEGGFLLSIELPGDIRRIKEDIVWAAVECCGNQKKASKALGLAESTVSHYMNGKRGGRKDTARRRKSEERKA
jgi:hypothetical protein